MTTPIDYKTTTRESYNEHAKQFAVFAKGFRGKLEEWIESFVKEVKNGDQILDVGCGAGRDAQFFIKQGLHVTGIDNSEKLIEITKDKVPGGAFFVMDFEELPLPKNSFEGIWANASLVHLPKENILPVLKRLGTVLKPGGVFFSTWRVGKGEKFTVEKRGKAELKRYYAYYQPEELASLLQKAGFTDITNDFDEIESGKWILMIAHKSDAENA